jgi:hypothetical protein
LQQDIAAGLEPIGDTPQELARYFAADAQKCAALVRSTNKNPAQ